jgi:hypothetical protein
VRRAQADAASCGWTRQIRAKVSRHPRAHVVVLISVAQRFFDPPLGELVLGIDAFGLDLEQ